MSEHEAIHALVLAAGRGNRLRPITDSVPKPLVDVCGHHLCDWQVAAAVRAGVRHFVMNTAHLSQAFESLVEQYRAKGLELLLSREGARHEEALESLGGIVKARALLGSVNNPNEPFLVLAGDVVHDFDVSRLLAYVPAVRSGEIDGVMVGVENPDFHSQGDMTIDADGRIRSGGGPHTYACLLLVAGRIFEGLPVRAEKLFPWLWSFADAGRIRGIVHTGFWDNVGEIAQLERLRSNQSVQAYAQF